MLSKAQAAAGNIDKAKKEAKTALQQAEKAGAPPELVSMIRQHLKGL
jgi:hypothetical protein